MNAQQKREQKQILLDQDWLTSDERGRRILWRLFMTSGMFDGAGSLDAAALTFREGQRAVAQPFFAALVTNWPDRLTVLLTENRQDRPRSDDRNSSDRDDDTSDE